MKESVPVYYRVWVCHPPGDEWLARLFQGFALMSLMLLGLSLVEPVVGVGTG